MAGEVRLNKVVQLLEEGKHVFGSFAPNGSIEDAIYFGDSDYDFVIFEMEHSGFDFPSLRTSMQFLLNRRRILEKGSLQPNVVPFVRIPPNSREKNEWVIKQCLDLGIYGIVAPHLNSVEDALHLISAARYTQVPGVADFEPRGHRGTAPTGAVRFWGIPQAEYFGRADVWPLDPKGEVILMPLIEEYEGVENLGAILQAARGGIGIIFAGEVDLASSMGHHGNPTHPEVEDALRRLLTTCQAHNVPCACLANPANIQTRIEMGFRVLVTGPQRVAGGMELGRKAVAATEAGAARP